MSDVYIFILIHKALQSAVFRQIICRVLIRGAFSYGSIGIPLALYSLSKFSISPTEREQNGHGRDLAGFTASLTADVKMFTYYDLVAISFSAAPLRLGLVCVGFPGGAVLGFGWVQCTPVCNISATQN